MELELGLKITRTREDVSSSVDFRFSKDPFGPLVLSRETDSRFIIIIHLKGFKKEGIEIDINEEGNRFTIRGRKPVEEMVLIRWVAWRKEVEFRFFKKVFLIPDFVDLDKIKARFDDDDATLTITMPKTVKGISGFKIEEDEEERDVSEAEHKEEEIDKGDVEEQSRDREESDELSGKSETEIQRQEEFGEIMQDKERESKVLGEEQKGFSGGLDEEERDVSEAEHKEEEIDKGDVEEQSRETEESDEQSGKSETEIQRQEEFGEIMQDRERESKILGGEQKGFSGDLDEKERDVSEAEHKEEEIDKGDVEEQSRERAESDEHFQKSETEIKRQEEFEEIEQDKERVSAVLGEEQKGFSGGLDEEQMEDDNLKKIQEIDEQDQILECVEEEKKGLQELIDSNKETEDNSLRNIPDFEKCDHHEETRHEEQELVKEQQIETISDDFGSRTLEEIEEQEPDVLDRTSKSRAMEKEMNDDDGLRKVEGIEEPARRNEESKIQEIVEEETSDHEKKQFDRDAKEDVDGKMGEGLIPNIERTQIGKDSDEHSEKSETEIQKQEEFGENIQDRERYKIDEQDQILEYVEEEEEKKGLRELTDSNKESEDSSLRKLPDIEGRDPHEQTRHEEQELVEQEAESKSDDLGSKDFEEIEEQEPDPSDRTSRGRATEKEMTDDDGLSKVQRIEEPERRNEERKIQKIVEGETSDHKKKQFVNMETRDRDANEEVDGKMGEGLTPYIERTQVFGKDDIAETETKVEELESDKLEANEIEKIHKLVEKKEDEGENGKLRRQSEDRSLIKLQESEEQLSKGQRQHRRHEKIKQVVEEKPPEANTNIGNDSPKPVQGIEVPEVDTLGETDDEGKEKKNAVTGDAKVQVDEKIGERFAPNIAETETKAEEFEYDKQKADEIDKIQNLVENKGEEEENSEVGTQSEDISLTKLQEIEEEQFQGQKRHKEQDKIKGLVEEQVPEADANVGNDFVNPFQGKRKSQEIFQEETKNQPEEYKEKIMATEEKITDAAAAARKVQETIRQREMDEPAGCEKESKTQELEKSKTIDGKIGEGFTPNTEGTQVLKKDDIADTDKLEVDEVGKIHEMVEKKEDEGENGKVGRQSEDRSLIMLQESEEQQSMGQKRHSRHEETKPLVEEKTPEASTNIGNDIPKSFQEIEVPEVDTLGETGDEAKEKKKVVNGDAKVQVDEIGERFAPNIAETETKAEEFEYDKQKADEIDEIQKLVEKKDEEEENARVGTQSEEISLTKLQEIEEEQFQGQKQNEKQDKIKGLVGEQAPEADANIGNDIVNPFLGKHKSQEIFQEETKDQPKEYKERIMATEENINDAGARKFQEIIREQELDEPSRGGKESKTRELVKSKTNDEKKEKEIAETETKEQESYRPNIHREQEKVQQLAEEKTNFSKEKRIKEEKEIAKKKTEFGDNDDISRKFRDTEQRDSEAMIKGKEEILLEEKVCDDDQGIIAMAETKAENDESRNVHDIDIFQKLIGEISGHGEVEDEEKKKKKTTEVEKRIKGSAREAQEIGKKDLDASGKYIEGTTIQELEKKRGNYKHAEEKKDEADKPEKIPGTIEQELVNLKSQLEQDNVEDGEKTQELMGNMIKDCDKKVGSEESITKTVDDDVMRKDPGIKEQELYEPKREHVSKIKGLIEEKTGDHENQEEKEIVESELEAEYGSLRKVKGVDVQELHEPKIHKERDKNRITGAEEPSFQEKKKEEPSSEEEENIVEPMKITESENSVDVQEIMKELPDKPDKYEEPCKISGVVEAGHNEHKEEQEEKEMDRAELENEEESSKKVKEFEQQEYDEFKRSTIKDKMQEIEEIEKTRTMEENAIVGRKKTKDAGLRKVRHDEDLELSKPYTRQKDDKIQELVEMETSDYREKVKKQDENDILRIQEPVRPDLDEQSNIPQLVEEEKVGIISEVGEKFKGDSQGKFHEFEERKSYEDWTHEEQEKIKFLVKEEATDPTGKHTAGEANKDEEQEEKIITKAEPKTEEDSSKKVHEIGQQKKYEMRRSMVQEKMQETEEKDKTSEMEKNEIAEIRTKTKDSSLKKVPEGEHSELGRHKRHGEEDEIQELVEREISDHREKVKEKDGDDTLISQETGELERHCKPRKVHQSVENEKGGQMENISDPGGIVEGDSLGKFQEFQKPKSYEDWRQEGNEETKKFVKEAADPKDKHTDEGEYEEEIYEKVAQTEMKTTVEDEINEKVGENKEPELDKEERYGKQDKLTGVLREGESDRGKEISQELKVQEKTDIVSDYVEDVTGVQEDEKADVGARSENGSSREVQTIKEDELEESEEHREQNKICETNDPEVREEDEERVAEEETLEEVPKLRNVRETKEIEAEEQKKIQKPMEEKSKAPEIGKEGNEETAEEEMRDKIENRVKDQEPYELLKTGEHDKIPEYHRDVEKRTEQIEIEEMMRTSEDVSSRKVQQIKTQESDGLEKHRKLNEKYREEEMNAGCGYKERLQTKSMALSESQDAKEKGSDQTKMVAEEEKVQELMTEDGEKEDYHIREGEQKEKTKSVPQVEWKASDDISEKNETEEQELTGLRGQTKNGSHQELVDIKTNDQRKEEKEKEIVEKEETIVEHDSSRRIHEQEKRKSDEMSEKLAEEETSNDNEAGNVLGEVEMKSEDVRENEKQEQDKKQLCVEKDTIDKAKDNKSQESNSRDDSSRKTQENEKQESHEQKRNEEQEKKNFILVEKKTKYCRDEEEGNEVKEVAEAEAEVPRKLKGIEKQESTNTMERHENQDDINQLVEEKLKNQEGEDKKSTEVLAKAEVDESIGLDGLGRKDKSREQSLRDNRKYEETARIEPKSKKIESRKIQQIKEEKTSEQERLKEQGRIKELVKDKSHYCRDKENREGEFEDGSSKEIQDKEKEESIDQGRDEKRDKIQEHVDREASVDDEEELEVEFEEEEEDWEAEIIQETNSDEDDNDKIRKIKRIRFGFRLVGGSTLFMSLIVIVIHFIRSKKKIRYYKF